MENPRIGERHAFASLAELFSFLDEMTVNSPGCRDEKSQPARTEPLPSQTSEFCRTAGMDELPARKDV